MKEFIAFGALAVATGAFAAQAPLSVTPKTCVYFGWDTLGETVQEVYRNREKFAATGFDGICMEVNGVTADGKPFPGRKVMASHRFTRSEFAPVIPMLKELLTLKGLRESLWMIYWMGTAKNRIGWTNDAAWAEFADNMRFVCALAKEVGFKGLFIDHEDYTKKPLFRWRAEDDPPYLEARAFARRRGAEVARAMAEGDPDVRFVFDRCMMHLADAVRSQTPLETSALEGDLWFPFLNGFVEAMAPGMRIVEGCENAYGAKDDRDYCARIGECRSLALKLIEPELRTKFLVQSEMSFGKYLDGWRRGGMSITNGIPESLFGAGSHCDRFFWVYGEKCSVVNWGERTKRRYTTQPWEEVFPGLAEILRLSVGDVSSLRAKAAAGELGNLVSNPSCEPKGKGDVPAPYVVWTAKKPDSPRVVRDATVGCAAPGSIRSIGGASLTFKSTGIRKGDRIYATFCAKGSGVHGIVVWTKGGAWQWKKDYQYLTKPVETLPDGWKRFECAMIAPDDVDGVGYVFGGRASEEKPIWFDDISIYRW